LKLRHHRKCMQRRMQGRWAHRGSGSRIFYVSSARRSGKTAAALQSIADTATDGFADHMLDALKYGFSAIRLSDFFGEFSPPPRPTELELVAQQVVQDAELFDRTLEHYFRPGDLEAIPVGRDLGASSRYYQERLREAGDRLGLSGIDERIELTRAVRRYSNSPEYRQWLRENPPEVRR